MMDMKSLYKHKIAADLHTHTIFSKHAYSTAKENIGAAKELDMEYIAITDHLFIPESEIERKNMVSQVAYQNEWFSMTSGIHVIGGIEMNLCQSINLSAKDVKKMEQAAWRPIGLHSWFVSLRDMTPAMVYNEFERAARSRDYNPLYPTAFAHIEREIENLEYKNHVNDGKISDDIKSMLKSLVDLACDEGIFLELNESSMRYNKGGNMEAIRYWLSYAKEKNALICLGTDSHYCEAVGKFEKSINMLDEVKYPIGYVLNCNKDALRNYFENGMAAAESFKSVYK